MSRINEKLGLKPAGKRSMMKLPNDARTRNAVTAAVCPRCQRRGANLSKTEKTPALFCTYCSHIWPLVLPEDPAAEIARRIRALEPPARLHSEDLRTGFAEGREAALAVLEAGSLFDDDDGDVQ